jgi:cytochrome P450
LVPANPMALITASAGRHERGFDDSDGVGLRRNFDNIRAGFGGGFHFCLKAARARLEEKIGIEEMTTRFAKWKVRVRGRANLPVTAE